MRSVTVSLFPGGVSKLSGKEWLTAVLLKQAQSDVIMSTI